MSRAPDSYIWFCDHYDGPRRCPTKDWARVDAGVVQRPTGWSFGADDGDGTKSYCHKHFAEADTVSHGPKPPPPPQSGGQSAKSE
jgi:hypothetical protein